VRTVAWFVAGALLASFAGAASSGCGCADEAIAPIAPGSYALVEPDPAPYVGYTLTYSEAGGAGTVRESYVRNGVAHDTVYAVIERSP
jgi:hypothetical protein